jgi:hypothetical protein
MLVATSGAPDDGGAMSYYQMTYSNEGAGSTPGDFYDTESDGSIRTGTFSISQ